MKNPRQKKIEESREKIILGEIGALLHDIGKSHPTFLRSTSFEKKEEEKIPRHDEIEKFGGNNAKCFKKVLEDQKLTVNIGEEETSVYTLISKHHESLDMLTSLLTSCDRLDSSDDKGIVRRKQSINNTVIRSPFGYTKEKIELSCLEVQFDKMVKKLTGHLQDYAQDKISISKLREEIINEIQTPFLQTLGETRVPANDVTLWAHSYSTASLYKTILCSLVLGENPEPEDLKWRIFGVSWNGLEFVEKGSKPADILSRTKIIKQIQSEIREELEIKYPIGNVVYEDINGIFFTFPYIEKNKLFTQVELANEYIESILSKVLEISSSELWPFFTLSRPSRSLTIIGEELRFTAEKRKIPKIKPCIFIEGEKQLLDNNNFYFLPNEKEIKDYQDICPHCRIRSKERQKERCQTCYERIEGRLKNWLTSREETIWTSDVGDRNNRIALLTLEFNLDNWLDGVLIGTLYSQTLCDWYTEYQDKCQEEIGDAQIFSLEDKALQVINEVFMYMDDQKYLKGLDQKAARKKASSRFSSFFPDLRGPFKQGKIEKIWCDFRSKLPNNDDPECVLAALFTQNPSPARLSRIWEETQDFYATIIEKLSDSQLQKERIKFTVEGMQVLRDLNGEKTSCIIKINNLVPDTLFVIGDHKEFYTIESLEKFTFKNQSGIEAIKNALVEEGFYWLALENKPNINLLDQSNEKPIKVRQENITCEKYYPFIELVRTPLLFQTIIPASDAIDILNMVVALYEERFAKVIGKLPLNVGLIVADRKFPLYLLLNASRRILRNKCFTEQVFMEPWWDISSVSDDVFYSYYPKTTLSPEKTYYTLDNLDILSEGKTYALYPSYFDFNFVDSNQDIYSLIYQDKKRVHSDYQLFSARPYYLHEYKQMVNLWEILNDNISNTQIHFIEQALTTKMREWCNVEDLEKENVLLEYTKTVLKDAFGDSWEELSEETRLFILDCAKKGLLLDTIDLFQHVVRDKGGK